MNCVRKKDHVVPNVLRHAQRKSKVQRNLFLPDSTGPGNQRTKLANRKAQAADCTTPLSHYSNTALTLQRYESLKPKVNKQNKNRLEEMQGSPKRAKLPAPVFT